MSRAKAPTYAKERTQFVFLKPCGHPRGLVEGSYAKTMDGAWDSFADNRADERSMRDQGVTCVHVSHAEYVERFYPHMLGCEHDGPATS